MVDVRLLLSYDPGATPRIEVISWKVVPERFSRPGLIEDAQGRCLETDKRIVRINDVTREDARFFQSRITEFYVDVRDGNPTRFRRRDHGRYFIFDFSEMPAAVRTRFHAGATVEDRTYTISRDNLRQYVKQNPKVAELIAQAKMIRTPDWAKPET